MGYVKRGLASSHYDTLVYLPVCDIPYSYPVVKRLGEPSERRTARRWES